MRCRCGGLLVPAFAEDGGVCGDGDAHEVPGPDGLLAHPNVVPLLVTRPLSGPLAQRPVGTQRPLEELLEVFITAGFDPHGALHAPVDAIVAGTTARSA